MLERDEPFDPDFQKFGDTDIAEGVIDDVNIEFMMRLTTQSYINEPAWIRWEDKRKLHLQFREEAYRSYGGKYAHEAHVCVTGVGEEAQLSYEGRELDFEDLLGFVRERTFMINSAREIYGSFLSDRNGKLVYTEQESSEINFIFSQYEWVSEVLRLNAEKIADFLSDDTLTEVLQDCEVQTPFVQRVKNLDPLREWRYFRDVFVKLASDKRSLFLKDDGRAGAGLAARAILLEDEKHNPTKD